MGLLILVSLVLSVHQTVIYFRYFEWKDAKKIEMNEHGVMFYWELNERDTLYLTSMIFLGIMAKAFYEEEKYWVARNEMWNPDSEFPTKAWKAVMPGLLKEQQEFLDSLPPIRTRP